jgi:NitT/TauT family transport system substrate-binding protein
MATTHTGRSASVRRKAILPIVAIASVLLAATACGSGDAATSGGGSSTNIGVAYSQPIDYQVAKIAVDKGYFKKNGLNVTLKSATTGAQILALLASEQIQFGQMNQQIILNAYKKGTDLKICPMGSQLQRTPDTASIAAITVPGTGIKSAADLKGKTIAVNALATAYTDVTQEMLAKNGVDPNGAKIVVVPFNLMLQALKQGRVQAAVVQSPYLGQALDGGASVVDYPTNYLAQNTLWTSCFVLTKYASAHPDTVRKYTAAMKDAVAYANAHPIDAEKLAAEAADVPFVENKRYPIWVDHVEASSLQNWADLMNKYQNADLKLDAASMIVGQ